MPEHQPVRVILPAAAVMVAAGWQQRPELRPAVLVLVGRLGMQA
jgi:hypothetical protein